jgi:hypothetical protein
MVRRAGEVAAPVLEFVVRSLLRPGLTADTTLGGWEFPDVSAAPFGEHGTAVTGVEPGPRGPGALAPREGNSVPGLSWARVAG